MVWKLLSLIMRIVSLPAIWFCGLLRTAIRHYVYFSKAVIFIFGLIFSHSFVDNAVVYLFMDYIIDLSQSLPVAAITVSVRDGLSVIFTAIITIIGDAWIGRYKAIALSTASYVMGLSLWSSYYWFLADSSSSVNILKLIYTVMLLVMLGEASKDPSLKVFLRDQLVDRKPNAVDTELVEHKPDRNTDEDPYRYAKGRRRFWWRIASSLGMAASVIISGIFDDDDDDDDDNDKIVFTISASVMALAFIIFVSGYRFYYREEKTRTPDVILEKKRSPAIILTRVIKAAFVKRHLQDLSEPNNYYKNDSSKPLLWPDIGYGRWLNKAALLDSSSSLSVEEQVKKGRLCTVQEVKLVKQLFALLPMWTVLPIHGIVLATGLTFFVAQADRLDTTVSINTLFLLHQFVIAAVPYVYGFLVETWIDKVLKHHNHRVGLIRIGFGMVCSLLCCLACIVVEIRRRRIAHDLQVEGIYHEHCFGMTTKWLVPQFVLLGLTEGLVSDGFADFYDGHTDKSLTVYESPFNEFMIGMGKLLSALLVFGFKGSWFHHSLMESRLDKYYILLGCLSSLNGCFYSMIVYIYAWNSPHLRGTPDDEDSTHDQHSPKSP